MTPDRNTGDSCEDCGLPLEPHERMKLSKRCDPCDEYLSHQDADADDERMRAISE